MCWNFLCAALALRSTLIAWCKPTFWCNSQQCACFGFFFLKSLQCIWLILSVGMDFRFCILHFRWGGSWEAAEESGEGKLLMRVLGGSSMASSVCLYTADHHSSQGSSWYMIIIWWGDEENTRLFKREGRRKLNRIFYLYSWQRISEHILWWVESLGVFQ